MKKPSPRSLIALGAAMVLGAGVALVVLPQVDPTESVIPAEVQRAVAVEPFIPAAVGDCVTWQQTSANAITDFQTTECASAHRFEVTEVIHLDTLPTAEFAEGAPLPTADRQRQLREEFCVIAANQYLQDGFDAAGRFAVSPILPPESAWEAGDRTMLCGLQVPTTGGLVAESQGSAQGADQSRTLAQGQCAAEVDGQVTREPVDCAEDHIFEVTALVDMSSQFPDTVPSTADQDVYLEQLCTQAAQDYLGGDDALYTSTLIPLWTTLPLSSWLAGTRKVNCSLAFRNEDGGFATLRGSATGTFTINGEPPAEMPERRPLLDDSSAAGE